MSRLPSAAALRSFDCHEDSESDEDLTNVIALKQELLASSRRAARDAESRRSLAKSSSSRLEESTDLDLSNGSSSSNMSYQRGHVSSSCISSTRSSTSPKPLQNHPPTSPRKAPAAKRKQYPHFIHPSSLAPIRASAGTDQSTQHAFCGPNGTPKPKRVGPANVSSALTTSSSATEKSSSHAPDMAPSSRPLKRAKNSALESTAGVSTPKPLRKHQTELAVPTRASAASSSSAASKSNKFMQKSFQSTKKKTQKELEQLQKDVLKMRYPEYFNYLHEHGLDPGFGIPIPIGRPSNLLAHMTVLYIPKLNVLSIHHLTYLKRQGATCVFSYSSAVTHIITQNEDWPGEKTFLKALGPPIKQMSDIPLTTPIVSYRQVCKFIYDVMGGIRKTVSFEPQNEIAVFIKRHVKPSGKETAGSRHSLNQSSHDESDYVPPEISWTKEQAARSSMACTPASTSSLPSRPTVVHAGSPSVSSDPLTQNSDFEAILKAVEQGDEVDIFSSDDEAEPHVQSAHAVYFEVNQEADSENERDGSDDDACDALSKKKMLKTTGFACKDTEFTKNGLSPNQDIIDELQRLRDHHENNKTLQDDHWRAMQYGKVINTLRRITKRITSMEDLEGLPNIGQKTAVKIMEFVQKGYIKRLQFEENSPESKAVTLFTGIYGVGPNVAKGWYMKGLRTLDDVRQGKNGVTLTPAQETGLNYYNDLNERMDRLEAEAIFGQVQLTALKIDPKLSIDIMGSYRRGQDSCGDIDILLTRPTNDGGTHRGILRELIPRLRALGIITEDLSVPHDYNDEEAKWMGLCKLGVNGKMRRIDILTIPYEQRGAALIYFTGDEIFNRSIRLLARRRGMSLNQRGLWVGVIRDRKTGLKTSPGTIIASKTEREIFDILGVPWQEPYQRRRAE